MLGPAFARSWSLPQLEYALTGPSEHSPYRAAPRQSAVRRPFLAAPCAIQPVLPRTSIANTTLTVTHPDTSQQPTVPLISRRAIAPRCEPQNCIRAPHAFPGRHVWASDRVCLSPRKMPASEHACAAKAACSFPCRPPWAPRADKCPQSSARASVRADPGQRARASKKEARCPSLPVTGPHSSSENPRALRRCSTQKTLKKRREAADTLGICPAN